MLRKQNHYNMVNSTTLLNTCFRFQSSTSTTQQHQQTPKARKSPLGDLSTSKKKSESENQQHQSDEAKMFDEAEWNSRPFYGKMSSQARVAASAAVCIVISIPMLYQKMQQDEMNRQEMLRIEEQVERELDELFNKKDKILLLMEQQRQEKSVGLKK